MAAGGIFTSHPSQASDLKKLSHAAKELNLEECRLIAKNYTDLENSLYCFQV